MKKHVYVLILLASCDLFSASGRIIHKTLEYVPQPASKATSRAASKSISNVDLSQIANDYMNCLRFGESHLFDLITQDTLNNGYKALGLLKEDIAKIKSIILEQITDLTNREIPEIDITRLPR